MKVSICSYGHFYDSDIYNACPYCNQQPFIPDKFKVYGHPTLIGHGSVSKVYKMVADQGEPYVVKEIQYGKDISKKNNAMHELLVMSKFESPMYVIKAKDYAFDDASSSTAIYLLEDYHMSLSEYISEYDLKVVGVLSIIIGICNALRECREAGVLHLDVQPKNVFVDDPARVKLGDFSSALLDSEVDQNTEMRGTLAYVAPEVYREGLYSERSDIYSAGIIMYALFNQKKLPFMSDTNNSDVGIYKRLAGTPLPKVSTDNYYFDEKLNSVINKACAFDPEKRYCSSDEFEEALWELVREAVHYDVNKKVIVQKDTNNKQSDDSAVWQDKSPFANENRVGSHKYNDTSSPVSYNNADNRPAAPYCVDWVKPGYSSSTACSSNVFDADEFATTALLSDVNCTSVKPEPIDWDSHIGHAHDNRPAAPYWANEIKPGCTSPSTGSSGIFDADEYATTASLPGMGDQTTAAQSVEMREVEFSAVAPKTFSRDEYTMVNIVMYEKAYRSIVDEIKKEMDVPSQETKSGVYKVRDNSEVTVILSSPDLEIEDNKDTAVWNGSYLNFTFPVFLPEEYSKKQILFIASVYIDNVLSTRLKFVARCQTLFGQNITVERKDVNSAFVSYASKDRAKVATIIMGMKKARPDMDIFFDIENLRSGDNWERELMREIDKRDILYLCWSSNAKASNWVENEWRYALKEKGIDSIEPVAIESTDKCPPPEELNSKYFNDRMLYIINNS